MITIINKQEEINEQYHYNDSSPPQAKEFPCLLKTEFVDYGIMGDGIVYTLEYCPEGLDFKSWATGRIK